MPLIWPIYHLLWHGLKQYSILYWGQTNTDYYYLNVHSITIEMCRPMWNNQNHYTSVITGANDIFSQSASTFFLLIFFLVRQLPSPSPPPYVHVPCPLSLSLNHYFCFTLHEQYLFFFYFWNVTSGIKMFHLQMENKLKLK